MSLFRRILGAMLVTMFEGLAEIEVAGMIEEADAGLDFTLDLQTAGGLPARCGMNHSICCAATGALIAIVSTVRAAEEIPVTPKIESVALFKNGLTVIRASFETH